MANKRGALLPSGLGFFHIRGIRGVAITGLEVVGDFDSDAGCQVWGNRNGDCADAFHAARPAYLLDPSEVSLDISGLVPMTEIFTLRKNGCVPAVISR